MEVSLIIIWIYFIVYVAIFFITSVVCAVIVKDEYKNDQKKQNTTDNNNTSTDAQVDIEPAQSEPPENHDQTDNFGANTDKKHGLTHYIKKWGKLFWQKKKIYIQIIPHLFDQATDIGVILQYYQYRNDEDIQKNINTIYLFYTSIIVLVFHRIATSIGIWQLTRNWFNIVLQLLDVLMIRSVWTSYKLGSTEPSTTQRYLGVMEATFEAMPQLLMSTGFLVKTGTNDPLIIVSLVSSLWSLTGRVSGDDKMFYQEKWQSLNFSYKKCPILNWRYIARVFGRFLEISSRLCLLTLMWMTLGGFATFVVIGLEMLFCIVLCILTKSIAVMGLLMYVCNNGGYDSEEYIQIFIIYRGISTYFYLITITIFANVPFNSWKIDDYEIRHENTMEKSLGFFIFLYCWIAYFVWPCLNLAIVNVGLQGGSGASSARDFRSLYYTGNYEDIFELIEFGTNLSSDDMEYLRHMTKKGELPYVQARAIKVLEKLSADNNEPEKIELAI